MNAAAFCSRNVEITDFTYTFIMNSYRTHTCDELRPAHVDQVVTLVGWVDTVRDHGGVIFIDLRDRAGKTQVVFHPEIDANLANQAEALRVETVIQVTGKVVRRLKTDEIDATNPDLATGEIEVEATSLTVLNPAAREAMENAMRSLSRPEAAREIAEAILST